MSPFNKGEIEKQDTVDPIWLHGWMPSVYQSKIQDICHCVHHHQAHELLKLRKKEKMLLL